MGLTKSERNLFAVLGALVGILVVGGVWHVNFGEGARPTQSTTGISPAPTKPTAAQSAPPATPSRPTPTQPRLWPACPKRSHFEQIEKFRRDGHDADADWLFDQGGCVELLEGDKSLIVEDLEVLDGMAAVRKKPRGSIYWTNIEVLAGRTQRFE